MSAYVVSATTMHRAVRFIIFNTAEFAGIPTHTADAPKRIGRALYAMNCDAVAQRYREEPEDMSSYEFGTIPAKFDAAEDWQAVRELAYQCAEGTVADSAEYAELAALRDAGRAAAEAAQANASQVAARVPRIPTHHLPVAETAKLVRGALKRAFPGIKFSVRSKSYSGGCSVDVSWTDGPMGSAVDAVIKQYEGKRFDGMIDMGWTADLWLLPDGSCVVASDPGSEGSAGVMPATRQWMPHPDAKLVSTGAYVSGRRETSPALKARVAAWLARRTWQHEVPRAYSEDEAIYHLAHRAQVVAGALVIVRR